MRKAFLIAILILLAISLVPLSFSKNKEAFPKAEVEKEEIRIRLKAKIFDPVKEKRVGILSFPSELNNYIVQFKGPVKKEWREKLEELSEVKGYIPDYAFLIRANGKQIEEIRKLPFVRWIGNYEPEYKIEPSILLEEVGFLNSKFKENKSYEILLFSPNDSEKVSRFISENGGEVLRKEGAKIVAWIEKEKIKGIAKLKEVKWIDYYREPILFLDVSTGIIGAREVWDLGWNGSGIKIAVVDTGIDTGNISNIHPDLRDRVIEIVDYTEQNEADGIGEDPVGHGTHVAGIIAGTGNASNGNYTGVAPSSSLIIQRVFDDYGWWGGPGNLSALFNDSKNLGAKIVSNSWGLRWSWGLYTDLDKEADEIVRNYSLIIIFAAGNDGPSFSSTSSPSNAKNVISVGASENNKTIDATYGGSYCDNPNEVAIFSSRGPTSDGRVKPDIVAPGTAILSTKSSLAPDYVFEDFGGVVEGDGGDYGYLAGTSQAAPHVAGAAAIILQYFNQTFNFIPSPALVKALLINGADDMGYGYISYVQGWGRLNVKNSIIENESRKIIFKEENESLFTENYSAFKFFVQNNSALKITLVWSDVPGNPEAEKALVNDLDLIVITPSGFSRRGNDFSYPYDDERDDRNNVENVFINTSEIEEGNYTVLIYGYNVPYEQKFALVVSGNVSEVELLPDEDVFPPKILEVFPGNNKTSLGEIEIRANVSDNKGIDKVWIEYSNDTQNWEIKEMENVSNTYKSNITIETETTIIYRVLANDTSGKISSSKYYYLWSKEPRKIFVVRSLGTNPYYLSYMPWDKLNSNWFNYGLEPIEINYTFLAENITYERIKESNASVLLIACACDFWYEFNDSEIEAIKRYTKEGHGLVATAGTLWYYIPNNNKLAPLFGMREDLSYTAWYFNYITIINQTHPIFRSIPQPYYPGYPASCVPNDYAWNERDLRGGSFISLSDNNASAIIVYRNVSYITHIPELFSNSYDLQLIYNALAWSNYSAETHDLEVEWMKVEKPYVRPNQNFTVKAKVSNYGLEDEINLTVMLIVNDTNVESKSLDLASMSSEEVEFNYSISSKGIYNVSVYVKTNESVTENFVENNLISKFIRITDADVIVVNDKGSPYESYYTKALEDNGIDYVLWDTLEYGLPSNTTLIDFNITIWFTGDDWLTTLTKNESSLLKDFLNSGKNLFISGQDIGFNAYYGTNYDFYKNYLHAVYVRDDSKVRKVEGRGDEISNGFIFDIKGGDGANNQLWPDEIDAYDEFANPIFVYSGDGVAGIKAQTLKYNVIYLAFGFEAINNSEDRKNLMNNSINFFYKYLYDKPPVVFLHCQKYTNSQPVWLNLTAIDDFEVENATLYTNFTGEWKANSTISLQNNTLSGLSFELEEGAYVWNYLVYDNSSFSDWGNKNCTLIVDRTSPIISNLTANPSYTYATISWYTNEPANSTIYYGTSPTNLNYKEESDVFTFFRSLEISKLSQNTKYYYKVTSCDKASNCNTSQIYSFTTLYQAYCGNGICDPGETSTNCPTDCPPSLSYGGGGGVFLAEMTFGLYLFLNPEEINISRGETKSVKATVVNPQNTTLHNITLIIEGNCCNFTFTPSYISQLKFTESKDFTINVKPFENASGEYNVKVKAYSAELAFALRYLKVRIIGIQNVSENITNVTQNITQNVTQNVTEEIENLKKEAESYIRLAERKIEEAREMNLDVSEIEELMKLAKGSFENGDYENAIKLAKKAYEEIIKLLESRKGKKGIDVKVYAGIFVALVSVGLIFAYLKFMRRPKVDEWSLLKEKWKSLNFFFKNFFNLLSTFPKVSFKFRSSPQNFRSPEFFTLYKALFL